MLGQKEIRDERISSERQLVGVVGYRNVIDGVVGRNVVPAMT